MTTPAMLLSDAGFSADGAYRYWLSRQWDAAKPYMAACALNPSTAGKVENDPTVRRLIGYAVDWGFGGLKLTNIFSLRATDPSRLYDVPDPVGPLNDQAIVEHTRDVSIVLVAWGAHGALHGRGDAVMKLLRAHNRPVRCLKRTKDGAPGHVLYLAKNLKPVEC